MHPHTRALVLGLLAPLASVSTAHAQTLSDLCPELATVVAFDGAVNDAFGFSVSLSGDTLAVGSPTDAVGALSQAGSVRVFVRTGGTWTLQQTLTALDAASGDHFGFSVSLSGDTLAIGAVYDDVGSTPVSNQGSVRIFTRSGGVWGAQATVVAADGAANDFFGWSVALAGDTLAVGAVGDDVGAVANQGTVRVFTRSGAAWTAQQTLTASDGAAGDQFGVSVSISGETLAVGVPYDDNGASTEQGSVRVFTRSGNLWSLQAALAAGDAAQGDEFGYAVSLSGDTLAVGVPSDDNGANANQGSVRMFTRSGASWMQQAALIASDGAANDELGRAVSLSGDTLAASATLDDVGLVTNQGTVRIFTRSGTSWSPFATVAASDGAPGDSFGVALALVGDTLAVGVSEDNVGVNARQGSARIFGNYRVWNQTRGIGSSTLTAAITSALAGDRLLASNLAFAQADGIIDAAQKRLTFTALEPLTLSSSALMTVANDSVFEKSPAVAAGGLTVNGRLAAPIDGSVAFQELTVATGGQFSQRGANVLVNQSLATASGGIAYLEGSVLAPTVSTAVGAQNRVAGDTDVFANYTNAGATVIQRGILYIYGTLTNTGTITGNFNNGVLPPNPGDGYSIGGDYIVSAESSIILAEPVWWLRVGGNFDVAIDSSSRFVMDQATLELTGVGPASGQSVEVLSRDLGAVDSGFATTNFPLGALRVRAGANASLADNHNNAPGKSAEAIYTQELVVPAGAALTTNGLKVYTRVATIAGSVSNPADIVVVPGTPPCVADIVADGAVNAADLALLLTNWGPCTNSTCAGDLDRNGEVGAPDLAALLASWGACAQS
jgi:hypothetical protein